MKEQFWKKMAQGGYNSITIIQFVNKNKRHAKNHKVSNLWVLSLSFSMNNFRGTLHSILLLAQKCINCIELVLMLEIRNTDS